MPDLSGSLISWALGAVIQLLFTRLSTAFVGNAGKPASHALWRGVGGGGGPGDASWAALEWVRNPRDWPRGTCGRRKGGNGLLK